MERDVPSLVVVCAGAQEDCEDGSGKGGCEMKTVTHEVWLTRDARSGSPTLMWDKEPINYPNSYDLIAWDSSGGFVEIMQMPQHYGLKCGQKKKAQITVEIL